MLKGAEKFDTNLPLYESWVPNWRSANTESFCQTNNL